MSKKTAVVIDDEVDLATYISSILEENDFVEVLSGVDAGEHVIVAGQGGLRDGAAVKALWQDGSPVHPAEDATECAAGTVQPIVSHRASRVQGHPDCDVDAPGRVGQRRADFRAIQL